MNYFYSVFAFTMYVVFYTWGITLFFEREIGIFLFKGASKYLIPFGVLMSVSMVYFFKNRKSIEKGLKDAVDMPFSIPDIGVLLFIILSFFVSIYNVALSR